MVSDRLDLLKSDPDPIKTLGAGALHGQKLKGLMRLWITRKFRITLQPDFERKILYVTEMGSRDKFYKHLGRASEKNRRPVPPSPSSKQKKDPKHR